MKIKENSLARLKIYSKIINVFWYIVIVLSIVVLLGITLILSGVIDASTFSISLEGFGMRAQIDPILNNSKLINSILLAALIIMVLLVYNFKQVKDILNNIMETGTPFIKENVFKMKKIAYSIFMYALTTVVLEFYLMLSISDELRNRFAEIEHIELSSKVSLPIWTIIVAVLILILTEILQYGYELQKDNDEIL